MKILTRMCIILALLIIALYISMIIDTRSVMSDARNVFLHGTRVSSSEADALYSRYASKYINYDTDQITLKLHRVFTLHDFKHGYIWIIYTQIVFDENGAMVCGTGNSDARWEIQKINGRWEVIDVKEDP